MMIEFQSDDSLEWSGFSASISHHGIQSEDCNSWLNMNEGTLKTPDYPNSYHNTISCKWLITVKHGYYISLKFIDFDVISQTVKYFNYSHPSASMVSHSTNLHGTNL